MKRTNSLALALLLLLSTLPAAAQTHRASVRGTVTDPNGAVVPGAEVRLTSEETGETRATTSDGEGEYGVSSLPPGAYRLEVTRAGFNTYTLRVALQVNQEHRADAALSVADLGGTLVTAAPPSELRHDSPAVGAVIENRQVENLPLDGRNFFELTLLVPGAVPSAPGSAGSVRGDFSFAVNGAREDQNNFLLDGVYNVDPKLNTFGVRPPVDAIREFEMLTNSYDASFGR
ncbi:MAG TPA: carboxypeptidase-like regulatory domain-containing protein, partial [Pyrinomonadaceae bacterium]|nr:carboxypeptidase-like regulatory domain-containing protein [Pyrinomonadaceae bacterium]